MSEVGRPSSPCESCGTPHPDVDCPFERSPLPGAGRAGEGVLAGKYRLLKCLGAGGLGIVFEAENEDIRRRVAIKVLHRQYAKSTEVVQRFRREARAAGSIGHENIVEVLDLGRTDDGTPFIVMELLQGRDLGAVVAAEGVLEPTRVADIGIQVLLALDVAHAAGIVHRDLKPENVFVTRRATGAEVVKLVDFGIALVHSSGEFSPRLTKTGAIMGTPAFMSPEQLRGATDLDARTDFYSLGVMLFELLAGRNPYSATSYATLVSEILAERSVTPLDVVRDDLPMGLSEVIERAMSKDRSKRFATAREMIEALQPYARPSIAAMPLPAPVGAPEPLPPREPTPPSAPRAPASVAATAMAGPGRTPSGEAATAMGAPRRTPSGEAATALGVPGRLTPRGEVATAMAVPRQTPPHEERETPAVLSASRSTPLGTERSTTTERTFVRRSPALPIGLSLAVIAAIATGGFLMTRAGPAAYPQPTSAAPPTKKTEPPPAPTASAVRVRLLLPTPGAVAIVDGTSRPGPEVVVEGAEGSAPKTVRIEAPGHVAREIPVSFGASRDLAVDLAPVAAAAQESGAKTKAAIRRPRARNPYE